MECLSTNGPGIPVRSRDLPDLSIVSVREAVSSGWEITAVLMSEEFYGRGIFDDVDMRGYIVSDKLFASISDTENPQGIMAVVKMPDKTDFNVLEESSGLLILDRVQDPGNLGTLIRTADAFGAGGIILSEGCADIYNPKVQRAAMGSIFHVPIYRMANLSRVINDLKNTGFKIFAAHLEGEIIKKAGSRGQGAECRAQGAALFAERSKLAVIIGNEAKGISEEIAVLADKLIKIPMPGNAESLNASVAAGIVMYELFVGGGRGRD